MWSEAQRGAAFGMENFFYSLIVPVSPYALPLPYNQHFIPGMYPIVL